LLRLQVECHLCDVYRRNVAVADACLNALSGFHRRRGAWTSVQPLHEPPRFQLGRVCGCCCVLQAVKAGPAVMPLLSTCCRCLGCDVQRCWLMVAALTPAAVLCCAVQARVMRQDWSWNRPALDYVELYYSCTKQ
jgi:hypothetical protein